MSRGTNRLRDLELGETISVASAAIPLTAAHEWQIIARISVQSFNAHVLT